MNSPENNSPDSAWPALAYADWQDTCNTLHLWTQIVGKVKLALSPLSNHWWGIVLYVTARGLTTGAMPYRDRVLQCEALGEYAIAEDIREILRQEQEHLVDLATALGEDPPDLSRK